MSTWGLKLRVDTPVDGPDRLPLLKKWVSGLSPHRCLFVREHVMVGGVPANHHIHGFLLLDTKHKKPKVRARLKKVVFEGKTDLSNGHYAMEECKAEEPSEFPFRQYENYLCKGTKEEKPDIIDELTTRSVYNPEFVDIAHRAYWDVHANLKKRKVRLYDDCLDACKRKRVERREEIARIVTDKYLEAEKPMNIPTMRGLVNLLYAKQCPDKETAMTVLVDMIMERRDIGR